MSVNFYDIYIVGVGGQGVLTIANLIIEAAFEKDLLVNYYPTKGMAQRGGFVKAQVRLGREQPGADIPEKGADLLISMELSETLKGIRFLKQGGDCLIYNNKWEPTAVMLGNAPYPSLDAVCGEVIKAGGRVICLDAESRPEHNGLPVRDNLYLLGSLMANTPISSIVSVSEIESIIEKKWPRAAEGNIFTFRAGMAAPVK